MKKGEMIYNHLFYVGISKEQFYQIKNPIFEDNRKTVRMGSVYTALFWLMSLLLAPRSDAYMACHFVFLAALFLSIVCYFWAVAIEKKGKTSVKALVTLFSFHILGTGIGIAYFQPNVRTASMIAFAIIVPTLAIKNTITDIMMQLIAVVTYAILCRGVIEPHIYIWGLQNLIIFSIAGIIMGHVINKERCERFLYAESAKELAEVEKKYAYCDPLTSLGNRRAFEEEIEHMAMLQPDNYSIVMLDLNGLKQANDTYGHAAGDELIMATADCLRASFEGDFLYRIGGDEFCVIHYGAKDGMAACVELLEEKAATWKGKYIGGFTISYGVANKGEKDSVVSLVKLADQRMYACKQAYYKKLA